MPDDHDRTSRLAGLTGGPLTLVRREAARVPLVALTAALQAWERSRGVRSFALRRGNEALQIVAHTPLGRFLPQVVLDDGAEAEAERIATAARTATSKTATAKAQAVKAKATTTPSAPADREPGVPATAATEQQAAQPAPSAEAVEAGAPGVNADEADRVQEQLHIEEPQSREDLPIPDFDNVSLGSLRARLRSLSTEDLVTLREWEQAHAHRLPVITLLDNRIAKLSAQSAESAPGSAYPTGGSPANGNGQRT